jgi:hypothetical protein
MNHTSRRTFGKQMAGALASLPVLTSTIEVVGQDQKKSGAKDPQTEFFQEHDTPPPLIVTSGSLILEANTSKNDWDAFDQVGNRKKWSVVPNPYPNRPGPSNVFIAHVKVVDGAGEMVFHFDNDGTVDKATPIHVTATLEKLGSPFGDCHITAAGNKFELDVPLLKKIKKKNNDPAAHSSRQRVRYMHSAGDDDDCQFVGLRIDKGGVNLFNNANLNQLSGYAELKVMMWWENI